MKIKTLFAKGLVISAIASTLALGAGVAGASASDGQHERNTSGSEHEQGSEHGHDDDGREDDGEKTVVVTRLTARAGDSDTAPVKTVTTKTPIKI